MFSLIQEHLHSVSTRVADIAAATSIGGAGVTFLADFNTYVQIGAGLVAIFAGITAAAFHIAKLYWMAKDRKK